MTNDVERRIDELTKTNDKLDSIEKTVLLINSNVEHHVNSQNQANERVNDNFLKLENEIKDQRQHFDGIINDNRIHFDERIDSSSTAILNKLHKEYMTSAQIKSMQDEEIIIQMSKRKDEIKEVKVEILEVVDEKVGSLKKLLHGILLFTITTIGLAITYFKGGS